MTKTSRTQIAKAFVALTGRFPTRQLARALAALLIEHRLGNQVDLLLRDINTQLLHQKGRLDINVQSSFELSQQLWRELERLFRRQSGAEEITFSHQLNKSLLGGLVASAPQDELDLSNMNKLKQIG